jgi:chloramphenicol 3-O-phosphotransferase
MPLPGRVVILNGTSSAGKSTIVDMFRELRAASGGYPSP